MTPETDALLSSIRRWLLAAVFLLGIGIGILAGLPNCFNSCGPYRAASVAGVTVALVAGLMLLASTIRKLASFLPEPRGSRDPTE